MSKKFGGVVALDDVTLEVARGEVLAVIGPNGSGKTTLINVISGAVRTDSGRIIFEGVDITKLPMHKRVELGIVRSFQMPMLFHSANVLDNIKIAAATSSPYSMALKDQAAREMLSLFNLPERQKIHALSEGQRKLLDILLSLVKRPKLLMLDEPTSSVSSQEKMQHMSVIINAAKRLNTTLIIVEHDLEIVREFADRVVVMESGRITKITTPQEI
ncbi:MAG: ATP-binding cassette domain-containing protein [Desulfurococcaceae archaeon]